MRIGLGLRLTLWRRTGVAAVVAALSALLAESGDQLATETDDILILE